MLPAQGPLTLQVRSVLGEGGDGGGGKVDSRGPVNRSENRYPKKGKVMISYASSLFFSSDVFFLYSPVLAQFSSVQDGI